jgi:hypothetical protein
MSDKRTLKALEELVKTEHMAVAALDAAMDEMDDSKMRHQYRKWRDSHLKQAQALNDRLSELGGDFIEYEVGSGRGQAGLWGRITGHSTDTSLAGMRIGAERGIKRYIDNIDDVEDPKALNIIRKNLEAKQDEIRWYDDQVQKERERDLDVKLETTTEKVKDLQVSEDGNKGGGFPFPLLLVAALLAAAAFFLLRRGDDSEFDDYDDDVFQYEDEMSSATEGTFSTSGAGASQ